MRFLLLALALTAAQRAPALGPVPGTPPVDPPQLVTAVVPHVWVLSGALDNTTVVEGPRGLVLVDDQFASRFASLTAAVRRLSSAPVAAVINTHYHGDHTGGNAAFHAAGAMIVAHAAVTRRLLAPPPDPLTDLPAPPAVDAALPDRIYTGARAELRLAGMPVRLIHPAPAHTDGDTIVVFPSLNVIAAGDLVGNHYPNIDVEVGGSIDGTIQAVDFVLSLTGPRTRVIPGHGPVLTRADVIDYRDMLRMARDRVAAAKAGGLAAPDVLGADLLHDLDPRWKLPTNPVTSRFPLNVYRSLP